MFAKVDANLNSTITAVEVGEEHKTLAPTINDEANRPEDLIMHLLGPGKNIEEMKNFAKTLVESLKMEIREQSRINNNNVDQSAQAMTRQEEEKEEEEVKYERQMMLESPQQAPPEPNKKLRLFNPTLEQRDRTNRRPEIEEVHDDTPLPTFAKLQ